jgi:hypothetical protein
MSLPEEPMASPDPKDLASTQALCWLLDELFDAEDDLLALVARPEALSGWRRERLRAFCERMGEGLGW